MRDYIESENKIQSHFWFWKRLEEEWKFIPFLNSGTFPLNFIPVTKRQVKTGKCVFTKFLRFLLQTPTPFRHGRDNLYIGTFPASWNFFFRITARSKEFSKCPVSHYAPGSSLPAPCLIPSALCPLPRAFFHPIPWSRKNSSPFRTSSRVARWWVSTTFIVSAWRNLFIWE